MCSCRVLETAPRRRIGAPRITADDSEVTCRTWQLDQLAPTARKRSDDLAVRIQRRILDPVFKAIPGNGRMHPFEPQSFSQTGIEFALAVQARSLIGTITCRSACFRASALTPNSSVPTTNAVGTV